jgi:hypothetical protein
MATENRKITKAVFEGLQWLTGQQALDEAREITKNFTLQGGGHLAAYYTTSTYTFMYSGETVHIFFKS